MTDTTQTITSSQTKAIENTTSLTQCTLPDSLPAQPIIDTILADVNAIIPNFSSLVSSYRLLVGSAEEIHRIPGVCPDVFERAVRRFDNAGTLIDILLDLLCCKIVYSSEFLRVSGAPIDLFRLFANRGDPCDQSHRTADQIITLEALRTALADCFKCSCFPEKPVVCPVPPTPPPSSPPQGTTVTPTSIYTSVPTRSSEIGHSDPTYSNDAALEKQNETPPAPNRTATEVKFDSKIRRRHI